MSAEQRRAQIIEAAAFVFADRGYDGATTHLIAQRAKVSEALIYRHFKSKAELYQAVLQKLIRQQDLDVAPSLEAIHSEIDYLRLLRGYLAREIDMQDGTEGAVSNNLLLASLAGDGQYAKLIFNRVLKMLKTQGSSGKKRSVLRFASGITPENAVFFISYIGTVLAATAPKDKLVPYVGGRDEILRDAVMFCARGLGMDGDLVDQLFREDDGPDRSKA